MNDFSMDGGGPKFRVSNVARNEESPISRLRKALLYIFKVETLEMNSVNSDSFVTHIDPGRRVPLPLYGLLWVRVPLEA